MKSKFFALITIISLFLFSCKTVKVDRPTAEYQPPVFNPEISVVSIPITLDMTEIEKSVNQQFAGVIYEDKNLEDDNIQIKISKSKNFVIKAENNQLKYTIPLKIWSKFGWKIEQFGISISDYYEVSGELSMSLSTGINISPNWDIQTYTRISSYEWITKPVLKVVGVNVPISSILDIVLKNCPGIINKQIDKSISEAVELKKIAGDAWAQVQEPMLMSEENATWLVIKPTDVLCSPMTTKNNSIQFTIGFKSFIECIIGNKPVKSVKSALPTLTISPKLDKTFLINYNVDVSNTFIKDIAKKELLGQKFEQGKKYIKIEDIDFFGKNGKMVFVLTVSGSVKGVLYFTGIPFYNKDNKTIEIKESDFELNTKNVLLKSANWLVHGTILKKMEPYLKFPVASYIDTLKTDVNKQIENYEVQKGIFLKGKINDVTIKEIYILPDNLKLSGTVKGSADLFINSLGE